MDSKIRQLVKEFNIKKEEYIEVEKDIYIPLRDKKINQEIKDFLEEKEYYIDSQERKLFGNWHLINTSTTINFTNVKTGACKCAWIEILGKGECNTSSFIQIGKYSTINIDGLDFEDNLYSLGEDKKDLIISLENRISDFNEMVAYIKNHRNIEDYQWGYYCDKDEKAFKSIKAFFEYVENKIG